MIPGSDGASALLLQVIQELSHAIWRHISRNQAIDGFAGALADTEVRNSVATDDQEQTTPEQPAETGYGFLIRITSEEDQEKAIGAFLRIPHTRCRVGEDLFLLTNEHVVALRKLGIPFEDVTRK